MKVVLIGAGNLATHLGHALQQANITIAGIYNRSTEAAKTLSTALSCSHTNCLEDLPDADVFFLCISDDAIRNIAQRISRQFPKVIIVHTAGSIPLREISDFHHQAGVLYPLQTFSKNLEISFQEIPLFIEATNKETKDTLYQIASRLSSKVLSLSTEQRQYLHLSAVFACNFVNHCYTLAEEFLIKHKLQRELLLPLIKETARKVQKKSSIEVQTGPAIRWDKKVMYLHEKLLEGAPSIKEIYKIMSRSIREKAQQKLQE